MYINREPDEYEDIRRQIDLAYRINKLGESDSNKFQFENTANTNEYLKYMDNSNTNDNFQLARHTSDIEGYESPIQKRKTPGNPVSQKTISNNALDNAIIKNIERTTERSTTNNGNDERFFSDIPTAPSNDIKHLVADYEGYGKLPYRGVDSQNRTVGYGHVITANDGTKYDNGISKLDAWELLKSDLNVKSNQLNNFLNKHNIKLTQNQYDSLISFTFNCGNSWMYKSALRDVLISGDMEKVGEAMSRWVYDNNKQKIDGLVNRRADEVEVFYDSDYKRTH